MKRTASFLYLIAVILSLTACAKNGEKSLRTDDDGFDDYDYPEVVFDTPCCDCAGTGECNHCSEGGGCADCNGSGLCNICKGSRVCAICNGTLRISCWYCEGSGYKDCHICDGVGYCTYCNGLGKKRIAGNWVDCTMCHGTGRCHKCSGSGKLKCSLCNGKGYERCNACENGKCPRCSGTGSCKTCNGIGHCGECGGSHVCSGCNGSGTGKEGSEFLHLLCSDRRKEWYPESDSSNGSVIFSRHGRVYLKTASGDIELGCSWMPYCGDDNSISIRVDVGRVVGPFNDGSCNFIVDEIGTDFLTLVSSTGRQLYFTTGYSQHKRPVMGALEGVFNVSPTKQVRFSKGNLKYQLTGTPGWTFFEKQYECDPGTDGIASKDYVSHFCWGYTEESCVQGHFYDVNWPLPDGTDFDYATQDWGAQVYPTGTWRTLSVDEWKYLIGDNITDPRHGYCDIDVSVMGLDNCTVLYPEGYCGPRSSGLVLDAFNDESVWLEAERMGAVCLPAAGWRSINSLINVGSSCRYWSSTSADKGGAANAEIGAYSVRPVRWGNTDYTKTWRAGASSVRLVTDVN